MSTAQVENSAQARPLRLAELLVPLSLAVDLGMGALDERAMRTCLLATSLAREMDVPETEVSHIYYASLLEHLGCTATSREEAERLAGDQLATRRLVSPLDFNSPRELTNLLARIGAGRAPIDRMRMVAATIGGFRWVPGVIASTCEVGVCLAGRLAMPAPVLEGLAQVFERWDGKGEPLHIRGEAIVRPARFTHLASRAVSLYTLGGTESAREGVRRSRGGWLDPEIADIFLRRGPAILAEIDSVDPLSAALQAEPEPHLLISATGIDDAARAFADMVDLLSPYTLGHSPGVAQLSESAATALGLPQGDCVTIRRAALLHDLGRVGVASGIWEKRGPLTSAEWEKVRLHAYYTERVLVRSSLLAREAAIAGMHHERLDGSGYHRGASGRELGLPARILAAADAYQTMTQERPHRPALTREAAGDRLAGDAREGRLDSRVVEAMLAAAGDRRRIAEREAPAGLSEREVEVLRLIAAGCSNREIADRLVISRRTAEHHVQHIYVKIGVSTRPGATLFALEHGLIGSTG